MHGKEKHENREFNLLVSKTKYFPLLNWSSQIENAVETKKKKVSFPFALSHVRRMFLFGVPLRFWIKRLLMSGEELSPQPSGFWDGWGNVGKLDLFLSLFFTSGLKQPQLWGTKSWSWLREEKRSFGVS